MGCVSLQINMLLNFKDEKHECPCPEGIREQLMAFHEDLMIHCGTNPYLLTTRFHLITLLIKRIVLCSCCKA